MAILLCSFILICFYWDSLWAYGWAYDLDNQGASGPYSQIIQFVWLCPSYTSC